MKIAFFLIPKMETAYLLDSSTVRQALEKMEFHQFTSLTVLDENGKYTHSITSTDILHYMKEHPETTFYDTQEITLSEITPLYDLKPININDDIEHLIQTFTEQEYTPVIDSTGIYIGEVPATDVFRFVFQQRLITEQFTD